VRGLFRHPTTVAHVRIRTEQITRGAAVATQRAIPSRGPGTKQLSVLQLESVRRTDLCLSDLVTSQRSLKGYIFRSEANLKCLVGICMAIPIT
jgi:hypothetical protein